MSKKLELAMNKLNSFLNRWKEHYNLSDEEVTSILAAVCKNNYIDIDKIEEQIIINRLKQLGIEQVEYCGKIIYEDKKQIESLLLL